MGSIITYDILCHETKPKNQSDTLELNELLSSGDSNRFSKGVLEGTDNLTFNAFDFEVDQFFAVGSPIGMFVLLEGAVIRPRVDGNIALPETPPNRKIQRPKCNAFYNIFHPYDPVAHRIEPLILNNLKNLKPYPIPYTKGGLTQTGISAEN